MVDTNYILGVIRILEPPRQTISKNGTVITYFRAQFPQVRNKTLVKIICWGKLGDTLQKYYYSKDYLIVQGYVVLEEKKNTSFSLQKLQDVKLTILKIYPLIISSSQLKN